MVKGLLKKNIVTVQLASCLFYPNSWHLHFLRNSAVLGSLGWLWSLKDH